MICHRCRRENPVGVAFCGACGAPLGPAPHPGAGTDLPPRTSGLAIASFCLAVCGLMCLPIVGSILGLILGIAALIAIGKEPGRLQGQGLAIAGIAISGLAVLVAPIFAAIMLPAFVTAREKARDTACLSKQKQLAIGMLMYQQDYDYRMPPQDVWTAVLLPYTKDDSLHRCPSAPEGMRRTYGYNSELSMLNVASATGPSELVMLFDAQGNGDNPSGGMETVSARHRPGRFGAAFLDGHARMMPIGSASARMWDPRTAGILTPVGEP